jgi:hypothetical protein
MEHEMPATLTDSSPLAVFRLAEPLPAETVGVMADVLPEGSVVHQRDTELTIHVGGDWPPSPARYDVLMDMLSTLLTSAGAVAPVPVLLDFEHVEH